MPSLDAAQLARARTALQPLLTAQGGVFTPAQARAAGLTEAHVRTLVRRGEWYVVRRGLLAEVTRVEEAGHELACQARLRRLGQPAVVSHESAWLLYGLPLDAPPVEPVVTVPWGPAVWAPRGARVALLPPEHVVRFGSLPVTSGGRTVVDVLRTAPDRLVAQQLADVAARAGVRRRLVDDVLRYCVGWPGVSRAREAWQHAEARLESALESRCAVWFRDGGLPSPELQVRVRGRDGRVFARLDFLFRAQRTVVEADGRGKYDAADVLWKEKQREDRLRDMGFEVVRATWADGDDGGADLVRRVLRAFDRAARRAA